MMKILLLAGGSGTRLWPYSKDNTPKQLLQLFNTHTLLQHTLMRFLKSFSSQDIFIVTRQEYLAVVKEQSKALANFDDDQFLVEPCSKNTAPAIAWSLKELLTTGKMKVEETILITPTDHVFSNDSLFFSSVKQAESFAKDHFIVAFGIKPLRADTGLGYFKVHEELSSSIFSIKSFVEKPSLELAERFISDQDWLWNIGVYILTPNTFIRECELYCQRLAYFMHAASDQSYDIFRSLDSISIDHAIIEKTKSLRFVLLDPIKWFDLGSWENLYRFLPKDSYQNVIIGDVIQKNCTQCLLISDHQTLTALDLENMVIVQTEAATFVSERKNSHKIKEITEEFKNKREVFSV